jgi:hypothetical protein
MFITTQELLFSNITVHCIFIFIISEHPEFYDAQKEKNKDLVERLKQVHVDSHGTTKDVSLMTHVISEEMLLINTSGQSKF